MAEVTRRRTGELVRKLFEIIMAKPDGMRAKDALEVLLSKVKLTEYEAGDYSNGSRRFEKIVRFATVDTVKAGWLVKSKGTWTVTEAGRDAHSKFTDPEVFYKEAVRLYREWKATRPEKDDTGAELPGGDGPVGEREVARTFDEAEEEAWQDVEKFLTQMKPYDFQELVAGLLRAMDYHVAWVAPPGKDGGVDILAFSDPLGTRPPRIKVQVKRQQQSVTVDGLRSFMAVLGDEDVGLFVNTGGFTPTLLK
ncbi:MAG: Mrr restriction system protein [Myxococcaceae bacterium]|jgi:restriction system protein|nr:Mrr restriction system protein [Myxococcaceae bacterium]MCA3016546.1 Mrr restriction system protein [Myxococcaceae bacterium]